MILIKNGHVVNPSDKRDGVFDILIDDGKITNIDRDICLPEGEADKAQIIDAKGSYVFPGFIDLHTHLRDPGLTQKEDIETGTAAAARGGYTTVCCMPNTKPVTDSAETVKYILDKNAEVGVVNVLPIGAITKNMEGVELSDIRGMAEAGICALSEDGKSVMDSGLLRDAMVIAKEYDIPIFSHCEDKNLMGGVMNAGKRAEELGLPGVPDCAEDIIAIRDILLAEETGARLHLCHNSTKKSYDFIKYANEKGIPVTGEVCPHHFALTDEDIPDAQASEYKMAPPLRSPETVEVLKKGLSEGVYSVIATDHAPHTPEDKSGGILKAANGIVGLETSAAITYTCLVEPGLLSVMDMVSRMSTEPARVLGIEKGDICLGKAADLVVFDVSESYNISAEEFLGKSKNMPYEGMEVRGKVCATICGGKVVYEEKRI